MKTVLFYEPFAGISGDMHIGAMIDLGVPESYLIESLKSLKLPGWSISFGREKRCGIAGTRAVVNIGHGHEDHDEHGHHHHHRNIRDIAHLIEKSSLNVNVKDLTMKIFNIVAVAEAKVHEMPVDEVHFHEVGAVDSIVDITAAAIAIDYLKPDRIISTAPELGGGFVKCAHGTIPVPAPVTVEILKGLPVRFGAVQYETTTPTGAAILSALVAEFVEKPVLKIEKIGCGVGTRDAEIPNLLRVYLGKTPDVSAELSDGISSKEALMIECNIDDMNPELFGHVTEKLLEAGAKDVFMTPVFMKKNRPGILLSVMSSIENKERILGIIFHETTTAGLREYPVTQKMLERRFETIKTHYGTIKIKSFFYKGKKVSSKAEYEDVRRLALEHNVPMKEIYEAIERR
ncbi:MAG: nickel pincer cofactor biosynthesis protein LarC [Spirochaetales bacterium]|nr:nickel pincer cofactor biosynthesis protein LarC [Spirochaetales bacterium]